MYLLLAVAAGFASVWLWGIIHRSYEGWYAVAWRVACYFPGISLLLLSVLNVLIHHTGSSGAIPLGAFFSLVSLWFLISIPLCFSGQSLRHCGLSGLQLYSTAACNVSQDTLAATRQSTYTSDACMPELMQLFMCLKCVCICIAAILSHVADLLMCLQVA